MAPSPASVENGCACPDWLTSNEECWPSAERQWMRSAADVCSCRLASVSLALIDLPDAGELGMRSDGHDGHDLPVPRMCRTRGRRGEWRGGGPRVGRSRFRKSCPWRHQKPEQWRHLSVMSHMLYGDGTQACISTSWLIPGNTRDFGLHPGAAAISMSWSMSRAVVVHISAVSMSVCVPVCLLSVSRSVAPVQSALSMRPSRLMMKHGSTANERRPRSFQPLDDQDMRPHVPTSDCCPDVRLRAFSHPLASDEFIGRVSTVHGFISIHSIASKRSWDRTTGAGKAAKGTVAFVV